jgi:hypothetical protein
MHVALVRHYQKSHVVVIGGADKIHLLYTFLHGNALCWFGDIRFGAPQVDCGFAGADKSVVMFGEYKVVDAMFVAGFDGLYE